MEAVTARDTCELHGIEPEPGQLTIHADRGSSMRSKLVAQLLADLGETHSRPHVSNDNPFSEAAFKILDNGTVAKCGSPGPRLARWVTSGPIW